MSSILLWLCLAACGLFGGYTLFKLAIPENNDIYW